MDANFSAEVFISEIVDEHLDKAEELVENQGAVETVPEEFDLTESTKSKTTE